MTLRTFILAAAVLILAPAGFAAGVVRHEDPSEQRIKAIAVALRCPVCQGETIYDSHSTVAGQMKALIREQVAAGKSDDEIKSFFVDEVLFGRLEKGGTAVADLVERQLA